MGSETPSISASELLLSGPKYPDHENLVGKSRLLILIETENSRSRFSIYFHCQYCTTDSVHERKVCVLELDVQSCNSKIAESHHRKVTFALMATDPELVGCELTWHLSEPPDHEYAHWCDLSKSETGGPCEITYMNEDEHVYVEPIRCIEIYEL